MAKILPRMLALALPLSSLSLSKTGDVSTFQPSKFLTQWGPQVLSKTWVLVLAALLTKVGKQEATEVQWSGRKKTWKMY